MGNTMSKPQEEKPKYAPPSWYVENVPGYRQKHNAWAKASIKRMIEKDPDAWYQKKRDAKNNKYKNDPEYAEKRRETQRQYYQKKKAEREAALFAQSIGGLSLT